MKENQIREVAPRERVQITLPDGRTLEGPRGASLELFLQEAYPQREVPLIAALVDGRLSELVIKIERDCVVAPIDLSDSDGVRIYRRSLAFVLITAWHNLFPDIGLFIDYSLPSGGYFCEVEGHVTLADSQIENLEVEMQRLIAADLPISRELMPIGEVLAIFQQRGELDKVALFQPRAQDNHKHTLRMYNLAGFQDYFHGYMVPTTGYLGYHRLVRWSDGLILQFPRRREPTQLQHFRRSPQLLNVFREYGHWLRLLGVENVSELNAHIQENRLQRVILISEALHEQKIAAIAREIWSRREQVRLVLIAGPSSSGKTTFSKRLAVQLLAHGLRPFALELDNYFVNREDTPVDENGEYDFETLGALDVQLFNTHLQAMMRGEEVQLPKFNFQEGHRMPGEVVQLGPDHIIIVEGIHGLNPQLVPAIPATRTFRIFVSALTQLNLDRHNRVPTTDTRLIRRIVRDARTRGYDAVDTLNRWDSVRRGEKKYIFPYQENADLMFNSALVYELAILKPFVEPLLLQVGYSRPQRVEAKRLLSFLQWFSPAKIENVPENSILREFVGGLSLQNFQWD
ncbi:MAG: nucleoside kinase [Chloroflexota bacterium]|nr:nucleoside kinase [Chloroflexota bacterium]